MKTRTITILLALGCLYCTNPTLAETYSVNPGGSIQAAIDSASYGDTVQVAAGTYVENITLEDGVALIGEVIGEDPNNTIIDGNNTGSVVTSTYCDPNTILEGFTLTGGNANGADPNDQRGGGMFNYASSPTILNCMFSANNAIHGGGMYNYNSSPTINNCIFEKNSTHHGNPGIQDGEDGSDGGHGGGIYDHNSSPTLEDCIFRENSTGNGGDGRKGVHEWCQVGGTGGKGGDGGRGAGMFNHKSSPMMMGCNFTANRTGKGGNGGDAGDGTWCVLAWLFGGNGGAGGKGGNGAGVYNSADSSPHIVNSTFSKNNCGCGGIRGKGDGGWDGSGNDGGSGAGMFNYENSSPVITNCSFVENKTGDGTDGGGNGGDGAGMYNYNSSSPELTGCRFERNVTGYGGKGVQLYPIGCGGHGAGMFNMDYSSPVLHECIFSNNRTGNGGSGNVKGDYNKHKGGNGGNGAGVFNSNHCLPVLRNCQFIENVTGNGGNGSSSTSTKNVTGNGGNGGNGAGICNVLTSSSEMYNCTFTLNTTGCAGKAGSRVGLAWFFWWKNGKIGDDGKGGGMANDFSAAIVSNSLFSENVSNSGGAIYNYKSDSIFAGCVFTHNTAHQNGSGMYNVESDPNLTNCTFFGNSAYLKGGGMYNVESDPNLTNCILWDNAAPPTIPSEINNDSTSAPVISYSDVQGGLPVGSTDGGHNIDADPDFADTERRLSAGSPCIGVGDNGAQDLPERDRDGNPRILGAVVDLGAFESTDLTVRNVTQDTFYSKIQTAINDANDFDEIRVLPGTYHEAINFNGKAVTLYSSSGPEVTIIDANGLSSSVVTCASGEGPGTTLEGFTITGGEAVDGGGMYISASNPNITGCTFTGNSATNDGGGIYSLDGSNPTITDCSFRNNSAYLGAGMFNNASIPTLTNCTFVDNSASSIGGGMYNYASSPTIFNCSFIGNQAEFYGGGIFNYTGSHAVITNCSFNRNSAESGENGGGIFNWGDSNSVVTNCIVWGNTNTPEEIQILNINSTPIVTYCDVQGGTGQSWFGEGCIDLPPLFQDSNNGDLRFNSSQSPCVDAGNNTVPALPETDSQGNPRIHDGNLDGSDIVDMGAIELYGKAYNITRSSLYKNVQEAVDVSVDGDQIVVIPGTYYENIDFKGKNITLSSTDPDDPNIVQETILDGQHSGTVVTFENGEDPNCILDGFTIRHGRKMANELDGGAGIYCSGSSPVIRNCIIRDNLALHPSSSSGVYCDGGGSPQFVGCVITNNAAVNVGGGPSVGYTVYFYNGNNVVLEDSIITKNNGEDDPEKGVSGVYCVDTDLTIEGSMISEHVGFRAGLSSKNSNVIISDCDISDNVSTDPFQAGGIFCDGGDMTIRRSVISGNSVVSPFLVNPGAGGIRGCPGLIEDCVITGNSGGNGGGLAECTGPILNCIISNNQASGEDGWGGGLADCTGPVVNCLITGNSASVTGGAFSFCGDIVNCTISGNRAADVIIGWDGNITSCIIWDNVPNELASSGPSYSCIQDWTGGGVGNTAENPNFIQSGYWGDIDDPNVVLDPYDPNAVWMDGNYRLMPGSPCIDAGDNTAITEPNDLDGFARYIDGDCDSTATVDMGVYEFDWLYWGDFAGGCDVNLADFAVMSQSWQQDNPAIDIAPFLNPDGIIDMAELLVVCNNWLEGVE